MLKIFIGVLLIYLNPLQFMNGDNLRTIILDIIGISLLYMGSKEIFNNKKWFKYFSIVNITVLILLVFQIILEVLGNKLNLGGNNIINEFISLFIPICLVFIIFVAIKEVDVYLKITNKMIFINFFIGIIILSSVMLPNINYELRAITLIILNILKFYNLVNLYKLTAYYAP